MESVDVQSELRSLLNGWDPIGVAGDAPPDEYDCMIEPLLDRLHGGAGRADIGEFLRCELRGHFALDPTRKGCDSMADRS